MEKCLPYIVTILCSLISGIASYLASRLQSKADLEKLQKQHDLDLEAEREKINMEKEKMELAHKLQLEQMIVQMGGQIGGNLFATVTEGFMNSPIGQSYMQAAVNKKRKQK